MFPIQLRCREGGGDHLSAEAQISCRADGCTHALLLLSFFPLPSFPPVSGTANAREAQRERNNRRGGGGRWEFEEGSAGGERRRVTQRG